MGTVGRTLLQVRVDDVDYTGQVGKCIVRSKIAGSRRFCSGDRYDYTLQLALLVDHAPGSLWRLLFDHPGRFVEVVIKPHGDTPPSAEQPYYEARAVVAQPDGGDLLGTTADSRRTKRQAIETEWTLMGRPQAVS